MTSPESENSPESTAVVAVIVRDERFLVIKRSERVIAPGRLCFPGGTIESNESEKDAVAREMREELGVTATADKLIGTTITPWNVRVRWWLSEITADASFNPNEAEVAEVLWLSRTELLARNDLLESNRTFLLQWGAGGKEAK